MRVGLPDAARMLAAAMLAYLLARLLQLHEAHWAVLSALVTGRAQAGGTARAGVERLLATIAGAALAAAVAAIRAWHVDGGVLLFAVLAPLCLLVALKPAWRAAPIAALIVLSSGPVAGYGALDTAILRTVEIALGALASVAVSLSVFPARGEARARDHAAAILHRLAHWLRGIGSASEDAADEKLRDQLRADLRELGVLAHTAGWRRRRDAHAARLLRVLTALHGDVGFLARSVTRKSLQVGADGALAAPLHALAAQLDAAGNAASAGGALPAAAEVRAAVQQAAAGSAHDAAPVEAFLLRSVLIGLLHVIGVLASPPARGADTGPSMQAA